MPTTIVFAKTFANEFAAYRDEYTFVKAAEFDQPTALITELMDGKPIKALEEVFCNLNAHDGSGPLPDWAVAYFDNGNRSLSVGDVVVIGETAWRCAPFGWDRTTLDAAQISS